MASLFDSLMGSPDGPRLPIHGFAAVLREWENGHKSRPEVMATLGLNEPDHGSEMTALKNAYAASVDKPNFISELEAILILAQEEYFGLDVQGTFNARLLLIP